MKTKHILPIAIIATLPLTVMADPAVGPAAVPANGTAVVATANPPYQTLTPSNDDKQHIASTAYVKGAYNDAIAAVNYLEQHKQGNLATDEGERVDTEVLSADTFDNIVFEITAGGESFNSAFGTDDRLVTAGGVYAGIGTYVGSRGVKVYTTWDNDSDNATRQIGLINIRN